jgi:serine/threonine-protein phosphatase 2B regulatory subunit
MSGAGASQPEMSEEEIEQYMMISSFTAKELTRIYKKFLDCAGGRILHFSKFLEIPAIAINPLRERLAACFDFDANREIDFKNFVSALSVFSQHGSRDQKLKCSFKIQDINGDGKICRDDLYEYLVLVSDFGEQDTQERREEIKQKILSVVQKILEEASSEGEFLSFDDFQKVMLRPP